MTAADTDASMDANPSEPLVTASKTSKAAAATAPSSLPSSISLPPNRFELELEFVQSLASPAYLHFLATSGILYQSSFLDFLRYLRYWKRPEYAKFLSYPHSLYFLDLLVPPSSDDLPAANSDSGGASADSGEAFRREMAQVQFRNFVHEQQFYSWQFRSARLYGKGSASEEEGGEQTGEAVGDRTQG